MKITGLKVNHKVNPVGYDFPYLHFDWTVEGAWNEDGKGESIWDAMTQEPGHVANGENGNVACDHYHRYKEDVPMALYEKGGIFSEDFPAWPCNDFTFMDGKVHDPDRIDFLHRYLRSLKRAVDEGIEVWGYQYWSIMDNFEWSDGYDKRFGIVYVDYPTLRRIPKDSAQWYAEVIRTNGACL